MYMFRRQLESESRLISFYYNASTSHLTVAYLVYGLFSGVRFVAMVSIMSQCVPLNFLWNISIGITSYGTTSYSAISCRLTSNRIIRVLVE